MKKIFQTKRSLIVVFLFTITISMAPLAHGQNGAGEFVESFDLAPQADGIGLPPHGVLFYCGNGGVCSEGLNEISEFYGSLGAAPIDTLTTFPEDLSDYRLIFLILPTVSFTSDQVAALEGFLNRGPLKKGRLVLVGDHGSWYTGASVANALLKALGAPIVFNSDTVDCGCDNFTTDIVQDRLTRNIPTDIGFEFACTDTLTIEGAAKKIFGTFTGELPFVAVYPGRRGIRGDTVVVGDSNIFTDLCDPGDSDNQFWNNLIRF